MTQFDFTTNIELRVPGTGKVYMIDRMTNDWAERHPLNVDQFIEDVYQEFAGTEFEESREALHKVWTAMLSVRNPQGDASIYPNNNGARRAAAMKVWLLAGDYWRRGFRMGDVLPERCPSEKITRMEDGRWISMFPKDMHLLENRKETTVSTDGTQEITEPTLAFDETTTEDEAPTEEESTLPKIDDAVLVTVEHAGDSPSCDIVDITDMASAVADDFSPEVRGSQRGSEQAQVDAAVIAPVGDQSAEQEPSFRPPLTPPNLGGEAAAQDIEALEPLVVVSPRPTERERNAAARQRRREQREAQRLSYVERLEREAREAEEYARQQERRKIFAAVGAAAVTLVMIYFFGLLGPAIFGLLCGGLLKG